MKPWNRTWLLWMLALGPACARVPDLQAGASSPASLKAQAGPRAEVTTSLVDEDAPTAPDMAKPDAASSHEGQHHAH